MKYFDDNNIYESEDDDEIEVLDEDEDDGYIFQLDKTLNVNKQNELKFNEIVDNSRPILDHYWDINDPFVRGILGVLFFVGLIGSIYYIITWLFY